MLAIGISMQDSWKNFGVGLKNDLKMAISSKQGLSFLSDKLLRFKDIGKTLFNHFGKPLMESFIDLWKGKGASGISKYFGKVSILGAIAGIVLANINILSTLPKRNKKFIDASYPIIQKRDGFSYNSSGMRSLMGGNKNG